VIRGAGSTSTGRHFTLATPNPAPGSPDCAVGVVRGVMQMADDPKKRRDNRPDEEIPFEEKGTDIVYSPVPPTLGNEGREKSRPPGAPETLTPREEHEISKKGEERIARQQAKK